MPTTQRACSRCTPADGACHSCGCSVCGNKSGRWGCTPLRCGSSLAPDGSPLPALKLIPRSAAKPKPTHYKVVCVSLYTEDIQRLDSMVDALKARGLTKANKSALIREALKQVDLDKIARGL